MTDEVRYFKTEDCSGWLKQMAWAYTDAIIERFYDHSGWQWQWIKKDDRIR